MGDYLLAALLFTAILTLGLLALVAVTVVPFVLALHLADRRGMPPSRWGAVTLVAVLLGLAGAFLVRRSTLPTVLALGPLLFGYVGPALVALTSPASALAGRVGRHQ